MSWLSLISSRSSNRLFGTWDYCLNICSTVVGSTGLYDKGSSIGCLSDTSSIGFLSSLVLAVVLGGIISWEYWVGSICLGMNAVLNDTCRKYEAFLITLCPVAELTISHVRWPFIPITSQTISGKIGQLLVDGGTSDHTRSPSLNWDKVGAGHFNFLSCVSFMYDWHFSWSLSKPLKRQVEISVMISRFCSKYAGVLPVAAWDVARNVFKISGKCSRITNPCSLAARNDGMNDSDNDEIFQFENLIAHVKVHNKYVRH